MQTAQPDRPESDRRKKSRLMHVKLTDEERVIYRHWYVCLRDAVNKELRKENLRFFIYKPANKDCALPQDEVRALLMHVFIEDWKCDLGFNDIDKTVHMCNLR